MNLTIDASLKRIAWAYGCAKEGSEEEVKTRALLIAKIQGKYPGVCEECGGPADFEDSDRVQCDCGTTVCSCCCIAVGGESYCPDCASERCE